MDAVSTLTVPVDASDCTLEQWLSVATTFMTALDNLFVSHQPVMDSSTTHPAMDCLPCRPRPPLSFNSNDQHCNRWTQMKTECNQKRRRPLEEHCERQSKMARSISSSHAPSQIHMDNGMDSTDIGLPSPLISPPTHHGDELRPIRTHRRPAMMKSPTKPMASKLQLSWPQRLIPRNIFTNLVPTTTHYSTTLPTMMEFLNDIKETTHLLSRGFKSKDAVSYLVSLRDLLDIKQKSWGVTSLPALLTSSTAGAILDPSIQRALMEGVNQCRSAWLVSLFSLGAQIRRTLEMRIDILAVLSPEGRLRSASLLEVYQLSS